MLLTVKLLNLLVNNLFITAKLLFTKLPVKKKSVGVINSIFETVRGNGR
jgi:hypothetical protein